MSRQLLAVILQMQPKENGHLGALPRNGIKALSLSIVQDRYTQISQFELGFLFLVPKACLIIQQCQELVYIDTNAIKFPQKWADRCPRNLTLFWSKMEKGFGMSRTVSFIFIPNLWPIHTLHIYPDWQVNGLVKRMSSYKKKGADLRQM